MNQAPTAALWRTGFLRFVRCLLGLGLALAATLGHAQDDPPGRVGRLAELNGSVFWWDAETGQWADAERNRPLTSGDRISTAASGRAEVRIGSTVLRLSNNTELEVLRLNDERMAFQLHSGSVALRVRSREVATEIELVTAEARLLPQRAGLYRVDRDDDTTLAGSWRGELRVGDAEGLPVGAGQRVELVRDGRSSSGALRRTWSAMPRDGFAEWVNGEDQREERFATTRFVSPEMTGAEELDRHGRWEQHPEFGALWVPTTVVAEWAPYRYGRWAWVSPWGWTWVDDAPWGFAPFHYGRWVSWQGRWGWVPGAYVQRPVYAPALVAWVGGGGGFGVTVRIGGPTVGWVPLAPREVYRPQYRSSPVYVERVNPTPPYRWHHPPGQVPAGPVMYGNQGVPNGVTVVPSDVLMRRQPVARGVVEMPRDRGPQPIANMAPPPRPNFGAGASTALAPAPWRRNETERPPGRDNTTVVQPQPAAVPVGPVPDAALLRPAPSRRDDRRDERRDDRRGDRRDEARDAPDQRRQRGEAQPAPAAQPAVQAATQPATLPATQSATQPAAPRVQPPAPQPAPVAAAPRPAPPPAPVAAPPAPAARPAAPEHERPRERDDERKRRPETQPGARERENLR